MDRKVPKYFINVMFNWFEKSCAYVRWGNAISSTFTISAGVRQGGLLSPLLFAVYMDVLISSGMQDLDASWHSDILGVCSMLTTLYC